MTKTWNIDENLSATKLNSLIDEYILGPRCEQSRAIMRLRFFRGLSYEAIAEEMQMSAVEVGRIIRQYRGPLLSMTRK